MSAVTTRSPENSPTWRTSGPASSRNDSATPKWRSKGKLVAERYSPQTFPRGKVAFSTNATDQPAFASSSADVAPPGPPPMINASKVDEVTRPAHRFAAPQNND